MPRIIVSVEIDTDSLDGDNQVADTITRVRDAVQGLLHYNPIVFLRWDKIPLDDPLFSVEDLELLGRQVKVVLEETVVVSGKLLELDVEGGATILDEDGAIHHCWPALDIKEITP